MTTSFPVLMSIGTIGNRAVRGCLTGLFALALTCGLATSSQAQPEEASPAPTAQTEAALATPAATTTPPATPAPAFEALPREAHEQAPETAEHAAEHTEEHHGLTSGAPLILDTPFFKINNSMVVTWFVAILLIIAALA